MALIKKTFSVENINIRASADTVEKHLRSKQGISYVSVSIRDHTLTVDYDPEIVDEKRIIQYVRDCGYTAYVQDVPPLVQTEKTSDIIRQMVIPSVLNALFIPLYYVLRMPPIFALINIAVQFIFVYRFDKHSEIKKLSLSQYLLFFSITIVTVITGIYLTAADDPRSYLLFLSVVIMIASETFSDLLIIEDKNTVSAAVRRYRDNLPESASVMSEHKEKQKNIRSLQKDDIVLVRPNEMIPADGKVIDGYASIDESLLSGIDKTVEKSSGSYVYAGTRCVRGSVKVRIEKVGSKTAMMHLTDLAEKTASESSFRSPFKTMSKYVIVYIIVAAVIIFYGWMFTGRDMFFALCCSLAVISSSCLYAIPLSSESSVMHIVRQAVMKHILFKSVDALETAGKIDTLIIEQDGTLTDPEMIVTDFITAGETKTGYLEYIAYALESKSDRPFARAITRYLKTRRISGVDAREYSELSTIGRDAVRNMAKYRSGTMDEILEAGIDPGVWTDTINHLRQEGKRVLIFTENRTIIGMIAAVKPLIPASEETVEKLKKEGIEIWLFTNGTMDESAVLSRHFDLPNVIHRPAKDEKERLYNALDAEGSVTAYISSRYLGNVKGKVDIPVMIGTGTDLDQDDAQIILTRNRLSDFSDAYELSSQLNETIQQFQLISLLYHAAVIIVLGLILPVMIDSSILILLAPCFPALLTWMILRFTKKDRINDESR
ncbi:MAG: HAD-IC family P-type ATPase [Solobacterium sp.]|nr:HAD-IC family P-type ATPase [Solobacterium sp.]